MGLDNGIILRVKGKIDGDCPLLSIKGIEENDWYTEENAKGFHIYDICYWRKCWNIRDILFSSCQDAQDKEEGNDYELTIPELEDIRDQLYDMICKGPDRWDDSIWDFEDAMNFLPWDIVRISALINYLKNEGAGRAEVYFYDSY